MKQNLLELAQEKRLFNYASVPNPQNLVNFLSLCLGKTLLGKEHDQMEFLSFDPNRVGEWVSGVTLGERYAGNYNACG